MDGEIPKLRTDLEFIPAQVKGKKGVVIKDSLGLIKNPVLLTGHDIEFLGLIDGKSSIRDIQVELMRRRGGVLVGSDEVQRVVSAFDKYFLLDSERFRLEKERVITEYAHIDVREAFLAGRSYPSSPEALRDYLASFFQEERESLQELPGKKIKALVAPHIDLEVGKKVYASAYHSVAKLSPEKVILLGTGHSLREHHLSLTEKDFETPLGRVKTDREMVRRLKAAGREVVSPDDFVHRSEHSLEFQLLFLQYLFEGGFTLVPLLCGSFHEVLDSVSRPSELPGMDAFLKEARKLVKESGNVLVVAGVDFSHIGPKFGHQQRASSLLREAKEHDRVLIDAFCRGDGEGFWEEEKRVQGRYNVCGFSSLTLLLELFPDSRGHLLDYDFWEEKPTQSAVSFAAIALEKK